MEKAGADKEYVSRVLNTFFNPFERSNILVPPNATPFSRAVHHAGGLALGYGGLGLVLRKVIRAWQAKEPTEDNDRLRSYVRARYPTISPDPNLRDEKKEERQQNAAMPVPEKLPELDAVLEEKEAVGEGLGSGLGALVRPAPSFAEREMTGTHDTAHMALAAAAAIAGGASGWKLAEFLEDRKRKEALTGKIQNTQNKIDALLYSELQRVKGEEKQAADMSISDVPTIYPDSPGSSAGLGSAVATAMYPPNAMRGISSLWWLWAVFAFALSYRASKALSDKNDPARQRIKQLQAVARERAKVREAPIMFDEPLPQEGQQAAVPDVKVPEVQAADVMSSQEAPRASMQEDLTAGVLDKTPKQKPVTTTAVDRKDPYAALLAI